MKIRYMSVPFQVFTLQENEVLILGQQQETTLPNISLHLKGLLLGNTKKYECFVVLTLLIILVLQDILLLVMGYKPLKFTYYVEEHGYLGHLTYTNTHTYI
jgi:hypothetical protein